MSDEKLYTEREVIVRERAAFRFGVNAMYIHDAVPQTLQTADACREVEKRDVQYYPLPKVERPRVVGDNRDRCEYRAVNGTIERRDEWRDWHIVNDTAVDARRLSLWADLLANPTETVEDEA